MGATKAVVALAACICILVILPVAHCQVHNIRSTTYTALENVTHVIITINRTGEISQASSVLVTAFSGTATAPQDFTFLNQRREFIANSQFLAIRIDIKDDSIREGDEWFQVRISEPSSGTIGPNSLANITIRDDDAQFSFEFRTHPSVSESAGSASIAVVRDGYSAKAANVYISTLEGDGSAGSATAGVDFVRMKDSKLTFSAGENKIVVQVSILPDGTPEPTESLNVQIVNVEGGEIGSIPITTISILDDDVQYEIVEESFTAKEQTSSNLITVTIDKKFNLDTASSVQLYTEDDTATATDRDYVPLFQRVDFAVNQGRASATLTILDDNVYEPQQEVFYVGIRNPQPVGFVSSSANRRPVYIDDNESVISLTNSAYTVKEADGSVTVQIRRTGDLSQQSSVRIRSIAVSATSNLDYTGFDRELTFAANQRGVDLQITIFNDDIIGEDDETFLVELYQATVSVLDSDASSATITIQDSPRLSTLVIVLIAVGSAIFVIILLIMLICCCAFMRNDRPREPFYYDRGQRRSRGPDHPQETSGRGPVTYIADDFDERDRPRRSVRHHGPSQNGGPRISEISENRNRPSRRETNQGANDQLAPPPPPTQDPPVEGRDVAPDRHGDQSDPRRTRSMFNPRGEREPYWGQARHSYHSSPNHYGYF